MHPWTKRFSRLDTGRLPSPCFVVDEVAVEENLRILRKVQEASGAKVLLALKAFSMWSMGRLVGKYLSGTCASGVHEAKLGRDHFGGEVHTYSAAYSEKELKEVLKLSDHVIFNSPAQWKRFKKIAQKRKKKFGLRVNPQHSEGHTALYDPSAPFSRLGTPRASIRPGDLDGLSGLHFHNLCEQDLPPLERTLEALHAKFGPLMKGMEWINVGGGHHITRPDYQVEDLIRLLKNLS